MKPAMARDIAAAEELFAKIAAKLPDYSLPEQVDIGAKLKSLAGLCGNIVDGWEKKSQGVRTIAKDGIKQLIRPSATLAPTKAGSLVVCGADYKALFVPYQQSYIDTAALKEAMPDIASQFTVSQPCERLNFVAA